jgi:acetyltransferase EpsM
LKTPLLIFPYSGTAIEVLDCLGEVYQCIGFVSDDQSIIGQERMGIKVYSRSILCEDLTSKVLLVHGSPQSFLKRPEIISEFNIDSSRFATVIHPSAQISKFAKVGYNSVVMANVVITANAEVGNHVCILPNSTIHHDSTIGDYTLIAGNVLVAGNVEVGENSYIGGASSIKNGVKIGARVLVGMAANVVNNIESNKIVKGNPAK